jgi:hypothetical protein
MKTFVEFILESSMEDLEAHISQLSAALKLSKPIKKDSSNKMIIYHSDLDAQKIFDILKSKGYYKMKGYDPNPNTWTTSRNIEGMSFATDRIFFKIKNKLIMVNLRGEHGSKLEVIFSTQ